MCRFRSLIKDLIKLKEKIEQFNDSTIRKSRSSNNILKCSKVNLNYSKMTYNCSTLSSDFVCVRVVQKDT